MCLTKLAHDSLAKTAAHGSQDLSDGSVDEEREWLVALHRLSDCALLNMQRTPELKYVKKEHIIITNSRACRAVHNAPTRFWKRILERPCVTSHRQNMVVQVHA